MGSFPLRNVRLTERLGLRLYERDLLLFLEYLRFGILLDNLVLYVCSAFAATRFAAYMEVQVDCVERVQEREYEGCDSNRSIIWGHPPQGC